MAHTPGPWGIQPDERGGPSDTVYAYEDQQQPVAEIVSGVSADRLLVAAAPELLEWIKECEHCLAHNWNPDATQRLIWNVRRIIAKAGGEPLEGP
jgi:hypothetical protein